MKSTAGSASISESSEHTGTRVRSAVSAATLANSVADVDFEGSTKKNMCPQTFETAVCRTSTHAR
jgi:hypothetical protein